MDWLHQPAPGGTLVIPIADENPTMRRGYVTMIVIGLCTLVYFIVQPGGRNAFDIGDPRVQRSDLEFVLDWATVPCEVVKGRPLSVDEVKATFESGDGGDASACGVGDSSRAYNRGKNVYLGLLMSMFLHGSVGHLVGNMLFLWIFGNNVEDRKGRGWFIGLYLVGGLLADLTHIAVDPNSTIPVVGASGAIAAIMGAYLVMWPSARIKCVMLWGGLRKVSAKWVLGLFLASQVVYMLPNSGVAWAAHVGGFVAGIIAGLLWRSQERQRRGALAQPVGYPA